MKVLVIDEDKFVRKIYESEFHQQNIEVLLAVDGKEGLEKAKTEKPDLIIMEMILTKMNGFDLLEALKKDKKLKDIPVIVCSMLGQQSDIDEATTIGCTKYYPKDVFSLKQVTKEVLDILMTL